MFDNKFTVNEIKLTKILFLPFYIFCWVKPLAFFLHSIIDGGLEETFFDNSEIFKVITDMQRDGTTFFYMFCGLAFLSVFLLLYGKHFRTYQAVGAALNIHLYLFIDLGIYINCYRVEELKKGEIILLTTVTVLLIYTITTSVIGAIRSINKNDEDNSLRTASIVYIVSWLYLACVTLPALLRPVSKLLGARVFSDYLDIFLDFNTHMGAIMALPILIWFSIFAVYLGLLLFKKAGTGRTIITVLANIIMIVSLMYLQISGLRYQIGETKVGVILFMFEILVLLFTVSTVVEAKDSENKAVAIIKKATPFVVATAIVVMLVSVFIPGENFSRKKKRDVTLDLSQYTVSDIADMPSDELGNLISDFDAVYNPFG